MSMRPGVSNHGQSSLWSFVHRDAEGNLKGSNDNHPNLRVFSGTDWQALAMAGTSGNANIFATATGFATSVTASSLTNTGAAFPTAAVVTGATGGLAGQIIAVGPNNAGAGTTVYGVILSNTATVIQVDRWVTSAAPFSLATTPNGTGAYSIIQGMAPAWYMGLSSSATAATTADTVLASELTTNGFARANATSVTHTITTATYSIAKTFTCTGGSTTINSEAVFTATGAAGVGAAATSGIMVFSNAEPSPPTLVNLDTLAQTVSVSY